MCGRYGRRADKQYIAERMQALDSHHLDPSCFAPSFNVAPQTFQPVVRLAAETGQRELALMRWGLIPSWSKDSKIAFSTINARAETVTTTPAFRQAMKSRRCLVPANWFYEWKKLDAKATAEPELMHPGSTPAEWLVPQEQATFHDLTQGRTYSGSARKQPYAVAMKDRGLFAFAGLWERWTDKAAGQSLETYTILTTRPNQLIGDLALHDRMPVILNPEDYDRWLQPGDPHWLPVHLLRPFDADRMTAWKVSPDVGNVRNNNPSLIEPAA